MSAPNNPPPQRRLYVPKSRVRDLGPLTLLPGKWTNAPFLPGRGWNMIALPFAGADLDYRLLVNQFNEELEFFLVDENVPNRGVERKDGLTIQTDQLVVTVDYEQDIDQVRGLPREQPGRGARATHPSRAGVVAPQEGPGRGWSDHRATGLHSAR
jgi:hypothetical protein